MGTTSQQHIELTEIATNFQLASRKGMAHTYLATQIVMIK
jgi:hypothetical protein